VTVTVIYSNWNWRFWLADDWHWDLPYTFCHFSHLRGCKCTSEHDFKSWLASWIQLPFLNWLILIKNNDMYLWFLVYFQPNFNNVIFCCLVLSSAVIEDDPAELVILLIVIVCCPSSVRRPLTITFPSSSPKPQLRMASYLTCKYLGWFSLRFVHFVSISWILYFWWIFWVIFIRNWYFWLLLQNRNSEWFQIWYASTFCGSLSDLFISCQYLEFCIFGGYFG